MSEFIITNNVLTKYQGNGGDVVIPDSVKEIGRKAFYGCTNLTIHATAGSCAERYAKKKNIKFQAI